MRHAAAPRLLILAAAGSPERREVQRAIAAQFPGCPVRVDSGPLSSWPAAAREADLTVVVQSWPDEFAPEFIEALLEASLAARLICCLGPWCASIGRTRRGWPPAVRAPLEQLPSRLACERRVLTGEASPIPVTADLDELFSSAYAGGVDPGIPVQVVTPDPAYSELLRNALGAWTGAPSASPLALLVDVDPWDAGGRRRIMAAAARHPDMPLVALAGFPCPDSSEAILAAGAAAVVAKLAPLSQVGDVVARAIAEAPGT